MASSYTTSLKIQQIGSGEQSGVWGSTTNTNWNLIEQAVAGVTSITMANSNYTLTSLNGVSDEARNMVIVASGTNSAVWQIVAPLVKKFYIVNNNTSGGYAITIGGATGSIVSIPNGVVGQVYCDGTNFFSAQTGSAGNFYVNGTLTVGGILDTGTLSATTITAATQFTGPGTGLTGTAAALNIGGTAATATTATTANAINTANAYQGTRFTGTGGTYVNTNPLTAAHVSSGSFGGMFGLIDGAYGINLYSNSGTLNFALGSNTATSSKATLDTNGNFTAVGNVTAYSDERLKKNWSNLESNFIERLAQVKNGTYDRIDSNIRQVGVSAQSLNDLMPEAVITDPDGTLSVAYGNAALAAVIELAKEVVILRAEIKQLKGE
jgi:hypothetical protein